MLPLAKPAESVQNEGMRTILLTLASVVLVVSGCTRESPEPEIRYVPVPVQAPAQAPAQPRYQPIQPAEPDLQPCGFGASGGQATEGELCENLRGDAEILGDGLGDY